MPLTTSLHACIHVWVWVWVCLCPPFHLADRTGPDAIISHAFGPPPNSARILCAHVSQITGLNMVWRDVAIEFTELIPRLKPGVIVHVHDIPYPLPVWYEGKNYLEQFMVQALLQSNPYLEPLWYVLPTPFKLLNAFCHLLHRTQAIPTSSPCGAYNPPL